ncbi:MAG: AAA family ATPase [Thermomicrobiales bacterium]
MRHRSARAFEAASYLDIATSFACPIQPMLVLVSGLSGSGKSTVAAAIARATNGIVLSSMKRKRLAGLQLTDSATSEWHQGIYTREWDRADASTSGTRGRDDRTWADSGCGCDLLDNAQRERFAEAVSVRGRVFGEQFSGEGSSTSLGMTRGLTAARRSPSALGMTRGAPLRRGDPRLRSG